MAAVEQSTWCTTELQPVWQGLHQLPQVRSSSLVLLPPGRRGQVTAPEQKRGSHSAKRASVGRSERLLGSARQRGSPVLRALRRGCTHGGVRANCGERARTALGGAGGVRFRGLPKKGTQKVGRGLPKRGREVGQFPLATGRHAGEELRRSLYPRRWARRACPRTAPQQRNQTRPKQHPQAQPSPAHRTRPPPGREVARRADNTGQCGVHGSLATGLRQLSDRGHRRLGGVERPSQGGQKTGRPEGHLEGEEATARLRRLEPRPLFNLSVGCGLGVNHRASWRRPHLPPMDSSNPKPLSSSAKSKLGSVRYLSDYVLH